MLIIERNLITQLLDLEIDDLLGRVPVEPFQSLMKKKIPLRSIDLNQISEKILGKIVMSFFLETIYACKLLHINPFNQPAVEEGKILALKFLQNAKS